MGWGPRGGIWRGGIFRGFGGGGVRCPQGHMLVSEAPLTSPCPVHPNPFHHPKPNPKLCS